MIVNRIEPSEAATKTETVTKLGVAAMAASGMVAAVLGLAAPAQAAQSGPGTAQDTINSLVAQGYHVIVNKAGSAPLDQSTVLSVRPGQTLSRTDSGAPGADNELITTITNKTVYVDVR